MLRVPPDLRGGETVRSIEASFQPPAPPPLANEATVPAVQGNTDPDLARSFAGDVLAGESDSVAEANFSKAVCLVLRVNFNYLLIEGHTTTFQIQVENLDQGVVEGVKL